MKVTLGDPRLLPSTSRDAAAGDNGLPMRWRAELERAQWQARQRYTPQPPAGGAMPEAPAAAAGPAAVAAPGSAAWEVQDASYGTAPVPAAPAGAARRSAQLLPMPQGPSAGETPMPVAGFGGAQPAQAGARATRFAPTADTRAAARLADVMSWLPQSSQVCIQGQRVSVVLRDADLAPDDWPALREQLRARCDAAGLELADLTINGVAVEPAAARR